MKNRIIGIDVARALAIMGMILVNFKIAFGDEGSEIVEIFASIFEGKASATFVVLAGIGMAFMSNNAIKNKDKIKITKIKITIVKRAVFLFTIGILFIPIWLADILHFYGVYMLITLLVLSYSRRFISGMAFVFVFIYPLLMMIWNYDAGWNFKTFEYLDFWSVSGFVRHLFFNGFHPVVPWTAFMLVGLWFGKQDLSNDRFIKKSIMISFIVFIIMLIISKVFIVLLSEGNQAIELELNQVLGTSPMPPLPVYMITGSSFAIFTISTCILIAKKYHDNFLITALNQTGQMALTFYVAHVVIGMGVLEAINPVKMGQYSIEFSIGYALIFSTICMLFANIWAKFYKKGPLEWILRNITK